MGLAICFSLWYSWGLKLEQEVIALRARDAALQAENVALRAELEAALKRVAELERGRKQRSSFKKPNKPKKAGPKAPRT